MEKYRGQTLVVALYNYPLKFIINNIKYRNRIMNRYNPKIHHRRSIRLKGYDYSQAGLYFVTICTQNREHFFGKIENGKMILNDAGKMVEDEWLVLPERFTNIKLHEYIVMPNHFHAILEIVNKNENNNIKNTVGATQKVGRNDKGQPQGISMGQPQGISMGQPQGIAPTKIPIKKTLGDIVGAFQSIVTVKYIRGVKNNNWEVFDRRLFQRNYWENIIRNEKAYNNISQYIINNPKKWDNDKLLKK